MLNGFLASENPTQIIFVLAAFVLCWHAVWNHKPTEEEYRILHVEKISFLLLFWFVCLLGSFVYSSTRHVWPVALTATQALSWNLAVLAILLVRPGPRFLHIAAAIPIIIVVLLLPKYNFNTETLFADFDRILKCQSGSAVAENCVTVGHPDVSDRSIKVSSLARGGYFFVCLFFIFSYYGRIYRFWYDHKTSGESWSVLDADVGNTIVVLVSLAISTIVGFYIAGADLPSLSIVSGVTIAAVTVALRDMLQNLISGVWIAWEGTIKKDDVIQLGANQIGWVERITFRYTVIKDWNDVSTLIPNTVMMNGTIQNWTLGKREDNSSNVRLKIDIGVAFGTDIGNAINRLGQAARRVNRVLRDPRPQAQVANVGDSAINLQLRFWIEDPKAGITNVLSQVYLEVLDEFERSEPKKIVIPFPQSEMRVISGPPSDSPASDNTESNNPLGRRKDELLN